MSLSETFQAIESALLFHYSTSVRPLQFAELCKRLLSTGIRISLQDVHAIQAVWPESYVLEPIGRGYLISASGLPQAAAQRRQKFQSLLTKPKNITIPTMATTTPMLLPPSPPATPVNELAPKNVLPLPDALRPKASRVIKRTLKTAVPAKKEGSLLERIRAKEAAKKAMNEPAMRREQETKFLQAQFPAISSILASLATSRATYSLQEIINKVGTSLRTRLSCAELTNALMLLATEMPSVCEIIKSESLTVVRVHSRLPRLPTPPVTRPVTPL